MKISECNYCGMMAITSEQDVCASCQAFVSPEPEAVEPNPEPPQNYIQPETNPFQQASQQAPMPVYPATPNNQYVPQPSFQNTPPPKLEDRRFPHAAPPPLESSCVKCGAPLPRGQRACLDCGITKKSSPKKYLFALLIIGVIGFFSFDYAYEQVSPYGTVRKYAKTTGADDSLVYENFVLKGETTVSVDVPTRFSPAAGVTQGGRVEQNFSFKMIYKKPNVSSIEMIRENDTVYKQVYDGMSGWKYTNMPGQPAGYQDTDDAFASKKMGLGLDEYDSLEFVNEATSQEFGPHNIKVLTDKKEFEVADIKTPTVEKTIIVAKQKHNGRIDSSLLVFDQKTGLLLGMIKNALMGNMVVSTIIHFDSYSKFPVKRKGLFGVSETRVLVPTKMVFVTHGNNAEQYGGMPTVMIELNVKGVETDAEIDPGYFTK